MKTKQSTTTIRLNQSQDAEDQAKREGLDWIDSFQANGARRNQEHGLAFRGRQLVAVNTAGEIRAVTISEAFALLAKWQRNVRDVKAEFGNSSTSFTNLAAFYDLAARATR